jgi:serine protease inhibitor
MKNYRNTAILSLLVLALMSWNIPSTASANSASSPTDIEADMNNFPIDQIALKIANRNTKLDDHLVTATANFGFKLFERIVNQTSENGADPNQNIFISPSSVAIALSMVYNGADGETQRAIGKTLEMEKFKLNEVNQFHYSLQQSLTNAQSGVELNIANSLWTRQDISLKQTFLDRVKQFYQAEIQRLDFTNPNSVNVINAWVRQKTKDKIVKIVERIETDSLLFLINAVYFKGKWQVPFNQSLTTPATFILGNGQKIVTPMMTQSGKYLYYDAPTFQAISLPYKSQRFGMQIFLPKPNSDLKALRKQLNLQNWQAWRRNMTMQQGSIRLPRFKIEYETELNTVLQKMGMAIAFAPNQANFQNISQIPSHISEVKHKTFVEVNEEGTEAAAVTSIAVRATSAMPNEQAPFSMIVNRPFFFAISDRQTGSIIFMGTINDPTGK